MDLIKGTMVESANDAAYSLSVAVAGSEERFAEMMNEKAREIGALESHFENASGLYMPGHTTSAYDLALIFRYALENKRFQEIVGTKYFFFNRGDADMRYMNHNRLLFCFAPSIGGEDGVYPRLQALLRGRLREGRQDLYPIDPRQQEPLDGRRQYPAEHIHGSADPEGVIARKGSLRHPRLLCAGKGEWGAPRLLHRENEEGTAFLARVKRERRIHLTSYSAKKSKLPS